MKQAIDPRLGALIAIVGVLLLVGIGVLVWMRPSATPVVAESPAPTTATSGRPGGGPTAMSAKTRAMFDSHQRTEQDRRNIEEFRRNNPNASTRFRP